MDKKTQSIVAYITIVGWIVALLQYNNGKDAAVRFHLKQSLGVMILGLALAVAVTVLTTIVPALGYLAYANVLVLILWILGIINAANGAQKPLPLVGGLAEAKLNFF
ncbi:DUF4870 domain-containing protein [Chitinophaga caseinilytica]|uniref:DUF4870 domain-containing protein n=1 Tax=Chitinophaga caseinilytica TaxID=2267521 RepID=A0ABZ2ZB56_9BACT